MNFNWKLDKVTVISRQNLKTSPRLQRSLKPNLKSGEGTDKAEAW